MNIRIEIRKAVSEDYAQVKKAIFNLLGQLRNSKVDSLEGFEQAYFKIIENDSNGCILIAREKDRICGLLSLSKAYALHCGGLYGILEELWVDKKYQNNGVGSKLIDFICDYCKENNIRRIDVGLPDSQYKYYSYTYNFYKKKGFTEIGTRMKLSI
ncbi:MAG: GNAT family N-acetyltransferase [Lachnospiraceae bacterium]|nr:GNAT family N-acetyltransferase [Lachnospiraceae bacterium]